MGCLHNDSNLPAPNQTLNYSSEKSITELNIPVSNLILDGGTPIIIEKLFQFYIPIHTNLFLLFFLLFFKGIIISMKATTMSLMYSETIPVLDTHC